MARKRRDPFEIALSADEEQELVSWLAQEIEYGLNARQTLVGAEEELDYWWKLYEGGDRTIRKDTPWPDAANFTVPFITDKVDSFRSRASRTLFVDPVYVVEGWGQSAQRVPFVEAFHQWKIEEERFQSYASKAIHQSLIETVGVLECYEGTEQRRQRREMEVLVQTNELGAPVIGEDQKPVLARDPQGDLIPADDIADRPVARVVVDDIVTSRRGPRYRVIPVRDFLMLPGHAQDRDDVWGYAKRFWRRVPELKEREKAKHYRNVDQLGEEGERQEQPRDTRAGQSIAPQYGPTAEKELWEILFLRDLDGDGIEEWCVATLSVTKRVLLRIQRDDIGRSRFLLFIPHPRPDSVWGYSFVGHKLLSTGEELSTIHNQITDRASLVNAAPLKRVQGALWDPQEQPFGPRAVIDVRDANEVQAMEIPDVPPSMIERERSTTAWGERAAGINDVASSAQPEADRTLGEVQLRTEASYVRMEEAIQNLRETLEEAFEVRHLMWIRALEAQDEEAPLSVGRSLAVQGVTLENGKFTAALLRGNFHGKPRGSVETADITRMRTDFVNFMKVFVDMATRMPYVQQRLASTRAQKALFETAVRVFRVSDKDAFLGPDPETEALEAAAEGGLNGGNGAGAGGAGGAAGVSGVGALLRALPGGVGTGGLPAEGGPGAPAGAGVG